MEERWENLRTPLKAFESSGVAINSWEIKSPFGLEMDERGVVVKKTGIRVGGVAGGRN